jgi:hypothetical protein
MSQPSSSFPCPAPTPRFGSPTPSHGVEFPQDAPLSRDYDVEDFNKMLEDHFRDDPGDLLSNGV